MSIKIGKFPDNKGGSCLQDIAIEINNLSENIGSSESIIENIPTEIVTDIKPYDLELNAEDKVGLEITKSIKNTKEIDRSIIYLSSATEEKAGVMSAEDKKKINEIDEFKVLDVIYLDETEEHIASNKEVYNKYITYSQIPINTVYFKNPRVTGAFTQNLIPFNEVRLNGDKIVFIANGPVSFYNNIISGLGVIQVELSSDGTTNFQTNNNLLQSGGNILYEDKGGLSAKCTLIYNEEEKELQLVGFDDRIISKVDASVFIKDGMINSVSIDNDTKVVTIIFNTDAGKEDIKVDFSDIYDVLLTEAKDYVDGKVGTNEYTNANYISKETNLTDAALQLDGEIKATNDNLAILNAATIKGVKVGNNTTNESVASGIVTISNANGTKDGTISKETHAQLNNYYLTDIQLSRQPNSWSLLLPRRNPITGNRDNFPILLETATSSMSGLLSPTDKTKLDSILSTGDGTKFLADDFTYKTIQMPDLSTYATKSELSGYLPLSGGTMTGTLHMGTNAISGSKYNIIQAESNGTVNIGATAVKIALYSDRNLQRKTNSSMYTIYDSGNFIAGTNYLAPGGVTIADVSGLQDSLDGKVGLTGDSYKNNNACWGGTRPDGTQTCLAFIDTNGNNKFGNCYGGTYVRASSINSLQLEVGTPGNMDDSEFYTIYNSGNFKAGTNYVAPSTLNSYLPLSGGAMSGNITMNGTNSNIYLRNQATITGYFGEDALPILYADSTNNKTVVGTVGKPLHVRSNDPIVRSNSSGTNYTIIDTYNTFNTITYTTSASEDNLRAWNNYVNGYVTNLQVVDSVLTTYTRVVNGVDIENKKFDVYIIGGNPVKLVRAEYTLADDGSITTSQTSYTLTPTT